jgi:hypothetical protein
MNEKEHRYYIVYSWSTSNISGSRSGIGSSSMYRKTKITCFEDLTELESFIEKTNFPREDNVNVVILNWKYLDMGALDNNPEEEMWG